VHIITMLRYKVKKQTWTEISKPISEAVQERPDFCPLWTMILVSTTICNNPEVLERGWLPLKGWELHVLLASAVFWFALEVEPQRLVPERGVKAYISTKAPVVSSVTGTYSEFNFFLSKTR
jgi:hypothetical protein